MASNKAGESKLQTIDLTKLNLMQLTQFKNQLDQDLSFYQESIQNLKLAQSKFQESSNAVQKLEQKASSQSILVPLTGSMYVPGQLKQADRVLVDIGTGYYLEKDVAKAKDYFERKVKYVTEQIEKVQSIGSEKSKVRDAVIEVMEAKLQLQLAQQQQQNKTAVAN